MHIRLPIDAFAAVGPAVWETDGLIVEKFTPEQDKHGYYMRVWVFFGDRATFNVHVALADDRIVGV